MIARFALKRVTGTAKDYEKPVATVCRECSVGCGLVAYVGKDTIVDVQGAEDHPVSRGRLCARGIAFVQALEHVERLRVPAHRESPHAGFVDLNDWDKALDLLAEHLRRSRERHGPESLLIGCDTEAGSDFSFCAKRFARLWGTPLVLDPFEEPIKPWPAGLRSPSSSCTQWPKSRSILLVESDLASTHPVAFSWLMDAQRSGAKIIAADSRFTRTMSKADVGLVIRPGTGNILGTALMKTFLDLDLHRKDRVESCFTNPETWVDSFAEVQAADLAEAAGVPHERLEELAVMIAGTQTTTVISAKSLAYKPGYRIWLTMATAMDWTGNDVGGWYPLDSGRPPMDVTGDIEEGEEKLLSWLYGDHRELVKEILEADSTADTFNVKAFIGSGNCLNGFLSHLNASIPEMDVAAYFGCFPNATRDAAHIIFPATMWPERDSVTFSNDRALQWAERILDPRTGCRSGLDFWTGLAQRFGWEEYFPWTGQDGRADHVAFYDWLLSRGSFTCEYQVDDLKRSGEEHHLVRWQLQKEASGKSGFQGFPTPDGKIEPVGPAASALPDIQPKEGYPLYFQATTVISRSRDVSNWLPWTAELEPDSLIQMNPHIAQSLGIETGDEVIVRGPKGLIEGRAWLSRMVPERMIWSQQSLDEHWVLIHRKDQPSREALTILEELLA